MYLYVTVLEKDFLHLVNCPILIISLNSVSCIISNTKRVMEGTIYGNESISGLLSGSPIKYLAGLIR